MEILKVRNVHEALPRALKLIEQTGVARGSRNGPVLLGPSVTTIYERPTELVLFWPERDANPFFHIYEALWMLQGRNDVQPLVRYAKNILNYSDDGLTLFGAYGHRWKHLKFDQLQIIARRLKADPDDRRSVLQMWSAAMDLDGVGKDHPCNLIATFQRGLQGELNLTVFCRSNDIIWGCYGANAVHFGMLLEYMALAIGCPVGTYTQISVNWHVYTGNPIWEATRLLRPDTAGFVANPYAAGQVYPTPMATAGDVERVDELIADLLADADSGFLFEGGGDGPEEPWARMVYHVLLAHHRYKTQGWRQGMDVLIEADARIPRNDWIMAGAEWLQRRRP